MRLFWLEVSQVVEDALCVTRLTTLPEIVPSRDAVAPRIRRRRRSSMASATIVAREGTREKTAGPLKKMHHRGQQGGSQKVMLSQVVQELSTAS